MSSFSRVSKGLFRERFKYINLIFIIDIIAGLYSIILNQFSGGTKTTSYTGGIVMSVFVGVILIAWQNEDAYINDRFRLIPVSDVTMYFSNIVMSIAALAYLLVGEFIFYLIEYKLAPNPYDKIMISNFNSAQQYLFGIESLIAFILGIIFIFTVVTTIHMLINWISNFLPFRNQTFVKAIMMFLVIGILMVPFDYITTHVLNLMGITNLNNSFSAVNHVMYAGMAMMLIWIAVFTIANIYFLSRWSETSK